MYTTPPPNPLNRYRFYVVFSYNFCVFVNAPNNYIEVKTDFFVPILICFCMFLDTAFFFISLCLVIVVDAAAAAAVLLLNSFHF